MTSHPITFDPDDPSWNGESQHPTAPRAEKREHWLEWRRKGIGGSDVPAIVMDTPRFGSEWEVWLSKVKGVDSKRSGGDILTGNLLESAILEWACAKTGGSWFDGGSPMAKGLKHWMRGSPDAWIHHAGKEKVGCEAKVVEYHGDEPLADHLWQCRWYMAVTDSPRWVLASFARKAPAWKLWTIERDFAIEVEMVEKCRAWWQKHVVAGIAPDINASHAAAVGLGHLHGTPNDREAFRVATHDEVRDVAHYDDLAKTIARLEVDRDRLGNQLRDSIADAAGLRWTGGRLRWSRGEKMRAGRLILRIDE